MDMVRRRRWHRKLVNEIAGAPPVFAIEKKDKDKPPVMISPRMFLSYDSECYLNFMVSCQNCIEKLFVDLTVLCCRVISYAKAHKLASSTTESSCI